MHVDVVFSGLLYTGTDLFVLGSLADHYSGPTTAYTAACYGTTDSTSVACTVKGHCGRRVEFKRSLRRVEQSVFRENFDFDLGRSLALDLYLLYRFNCTMDVAQTDVASECVYAMSLYLCLCVCECLYSSVVGVFVFERRNVNTELHRTDDMGKQTIVKKSSGKNARDFLTRNSSND